MRNLILNKYNGTKFVYRSYGPFVVQAARLRRTGIARTCSGLRHWRAGWGLDGPRRQKGMPSPSSANASDSEGSGAWPSGLNSSTKDISRKAHIVQGEIISLGLSSIKVQGKKWLSGIEPSPSFPRSFSGNPGCAKLLDSRQEHAGMTDGGIGRTIISCHAPNVDGHPGFKQGLGGKAMKAECREKTDDGVRDFLACFGDAPFGQRIPGGCGPSAPRSRHKSRRDCFCSRAVAHPNMPLVKKRAATR